MTRSIEDKRAPIVAREGWPIVAAFVVASAGLTAGAWWLHPAAGVATAVVTGLLTLWCVWFFRDPSRRIPAEAGAVISPADGVVCGVGPATPPAELAVPADDAWGMTRVSVFMNVFNVHVNRSPMGGRVERIAYKAGKFFNASFDKASEHNERCSLLVRLPDGRALAVVQIAGLVARRIVCRVREGAALAPGERFGLIRFGSRVDVYLPAGASAAVVLGQRVVAGETVIARLGGAAVGQAAVGQAAVGQVAVGQAAVGGGASETEAARG